MSFFFFFLSLMYKYHDLFHKYYEYLFVDINLLKYNKIVCHTN